MHDAKTKSALWIAGPASDLVYFAVGWLPVFAAFVLVRQSASADASSELLLVAILLFNFLHRHLTFPLVYADAEQFRQHRRAYLALPVLFAGATVLGYGWVHAPTLVSDPLPAAPRLAQGAVQEFIFLEHGAARAVAVEFSGNEATHEAVAARLALELDGWMGARLEDGRLRLRPSAGHRGATFFLGASQGRPDPLTQLGLEGAVGRVYLPSQPLLTFLVVLAVAWTLYHSILQKYGLMQIYARKAGVGSPRVDKALIFLWFAFVTLHFGRSEAVRAQAAGEALAGVYLGALLESAEPFLPALEAAALLGALGATVLYLRGERAARNEAPGGARFSWPRNLYVLSILGLYAVFAYDLVVGYAVFAFSHAVEYIAFVNLYVRKKYRSAAAGGSLLARVARRQALVMFVYCALLIPAFLVWHRWADPSLQGYILATGFLHFIYDGWLWKLRRADVGRPLGLRYPAAA